MRTQICTKSEGWREGEVFVQTKTQNPLPHKTKYWTVPKYLHHYCEAHSYSFRQKCATCYSKQLAYPVIRKSCTMCFFLILYCSDTKLTAGALLHF